MYFLSPVCLLQGLDEPRATRRFKNRTERIVDVDMYNGINVFTLGKRVGGVEAVYFERAIGIVSLYGQSINW